MGLFDKFKTETKKVKIEGLGNKEVTITMLTVAQTTDFQKRAFKGVDSKGSPELDFNELADIKIEKVSIGMIDPYMSVDELKALSSSASEVINEIAEAIDEFNSVGKKVKS